MAAQLRETAAVSLLLCESGPGRLQLGNTCETRFFLIFACSALAFAESSHAFKIKYLSEQNNPTKAQNRVLYFSCYLQEGCRGQFRSITFTNAMSGQSSVSRLSTHALRARNTGAPALSSAIAERFASQKRCTTSAFALVIQRAVS